jgi:mRNA interferase RelE/StbE
MRFKVILHKDAVKDYKKADSNLKARINDSIHIISNNPFYGLHIKKLKGRLSGMYRYKLGDIRIIYEIHNDISTIRVKSIETRGGAYK